MFAAYRDQLGRPINTSNAQAILAQLEALYLRDGYSRPEFRLDQDLTGAGILRIEVFEAQITRVEFTGEAGPYAARLEELASDLSLRVPLRTTDLQAALQSMRELPGLTVRATTHRDESRRNAYALTVATEYKPFDTTIQLSNRGTREIGPMFVFNQVVANSLFGLRERLGLFASAATDTDEYRGGGLFFDIPLSADDTHLTTTAFKTESDPTETPDRDDDYQRERVSLRAAGTFDSSSPTTLGWSAGFDWDDLGITRDDMRLRSEKLRVLELGGRVSGRVGASSQYFVGLQVRHGLNAFGSELDALDIADDPRRKDFYVTKLQLTELVRFAQRWSVRFDAFGQQSAYVLPDGERYKIGGERLGRGFEVTEIAGDQGLGAKAELRREMSGAGAVVGKTSLYGFYDFAAAWKQDQPGRESAATAGLGFAMEYWRLSGFVEVAKPLTHADVEGDRATKVFAELRLKL
ncbi:MAG TPA: ShlB/FhaC/HecB family hemolysin secretion/activation protein [Steroidobacteraceae bacterium]